MLLVTGRAGSNPKGSSLWSADCDCGNQGSIHRGADLKIGKILSCGCVRNEKTRQLGLTNRKYEPGWEVRLAKVWYHYKLTPEQYFSLIEDGEDRCAVCGTEEPGKTGSNGKHWHIDHDHSCCPSNRSCGRCIRGILCGRCNTAIGSLKDDPALLRAAADYVERSTAIKLGYES